MRRLTGPLAGALCWMCLILVLPRGLQSQESTPWAPPALAAPGLEVKGDPSVWSADHAKAMDPVYDGATGREGLGDLMGFYFDQEVDRLSLRLNLFRPPGTPQDASLLGKGVTAYVLLDYGPGGSTQLPARVAGQSDLAWERAIELTEVRGQLKARILDEGMGSAETARLRSVVGSKQWSTAEVSLWLPAGYEEAVVRASKKNASYGDLAEAEALADATPVDFYVFTAKDGVLLDDLRASNRKVVNTHNVAFMQHLNQGLTFTTVFRGERGENAVSDGDVNNPDDGADELLAAHDFYNLPVNWHQGGLLISAAEWHDPAFNDWLVAGVNAGRYEIITSALGQHIMPFVRDEINGKSVFEENDLIQTLYGYTPRVAWVPERVWVENPDNDGNGIDASAGVIDWIGDDFIDNGVWAVILDDYVHCGYNNGPLDDHHIYTYGGLKILPIDNDFVGQVNHDAGAAWNTILSGTSDEIILYGNDAEIAAEVSQGASNPSGVNNYIWLLQQCSANSGTVGVWKLTDVLQDPGFTTQPVTLQSGTYGLLGEFWGYGGGNNSWYTDWAGYTGPSNLDAHVPKWNYGQQWDHTLNKIIAAPINNISEMAWFVLMTNLHETGWHDDGQISGWQHHYTNHIRSANAHAEAARWAGGQYVFPHGAFTIDHDDDGADELVLYNERLLAVFDSIGGKLQWLFCKGTDYNYSVVSNDNAYWVDTDGDYNETNHVAALSDVSVDGVSRDAEIYSFEVVEGVNTPLVARVIHPSVTKTITLDAGDPYLKVQYRAGGEQVYVKSGFTPDNLDLTYSGKALERIWDPDGGGYFGQRNTNTQATAAVVVGTAGAVQNQQFSATLLEGDEFNGEGPFEVYVYGGFTSPLDGNGHVPELVALRDALVDQMAPLPVSGTYFPQIDNLTLLFDDAVNTATVDLTGFGIDNDDDGVAEVVLTGSDNLTTTGTSRLLSITLSAATAAALEALAEPYELTLVASSVEDAAGNGNEAVDYLDDVAVDLAPATKVLLDGLVAAPDWMGPRKQEDDFWDSLWNGTDPADTNEINVMFVDWDDTYLYLGLQGHVQGNSWILYLDTDVGGPAGFDDLTAIDSWERGATFSAPGFKPDYHYGAFQHQGAFDSHSLWRLTSATTSVDVSGQVFMAFDPDHLNGYLGGSELAIPWDVLYGLGAGQVPVGATLGAVASVCYDPEPGGELGGDSVPNNIAATLPEIDNFCQFQVDMDLDGLPDPVPTSVPGGLATTSAIRMAYPNPSRAMARVPLVLAAAGAGGKASYQVRAEVFDLAGRRVRTLVHQPMQAGQHLLQWNGRDGAGQATGAGTYFLRVWVDGEAVGTTKIARVR